MLTVAEVWPPPPKANAGNTAAGELDAGAARLVRRHREKAGRVVAEARRFADHAAERLRFILPEWEIEAAPTEGSPSRRARCPVEVVRAKGRRKM